MTSAGILSYVESTISKLYHRDRHRYTPSFALVRLQIVQHDGNKQQRDIREDERIMESRRQRQLGIAMLAFIELRLSPMRADAEDFLIQSLAGEMT